MGFFDKLIGGLKADSKPLQKYPSRKKNTASIVGNSPTASSSIVFSKSFDGEKNFGELNPATSYSIDYKKSTIRAWQSYTESDLTKTIIDKIVIWIIDKGLELQAMPNMEVLRQENIDFNSETFNERVELRFGLWQKSNYSTHSRNGNLKNLLKQMYKHAIIGGDALVILRLTNGIVTAELINTLHLSSYVSTDQINDGNRVVNGVEIDASGRHIAYHINKKGTLTTTRIEAYASNGLRQAFLFKGSQYRVDETRGISSLITSLDSLNKIDRYKDATLGSAEERQKIAFAIEHELGATGESPFLDNLAKAVDYNEYESDLPTDSLGVEIARQVSATTNKQAVNLPTGAKIKQLDSRNELVFKDFYTSVAFNICSALGIPPNVAFSLYNDSFSASRAATKDWEHTINVLRDYVDDEALTYIYAFWLHNEIMIGKVDAPGYLKAFAQNDFMVLEAYRSHSFIGQMFPHIDPLKEVEAERMKLGDLAKGIPLTTVERATIALNGGDSDSNMRQFTDELNSFVKPNDTAQQ